MTEETDEIGIGNSVSNESNRAEQVPSEDNCSYNSASTESTRPTVHTNKEREATITGTPVAGSRSPIAATPRNGNKGSSSPHNKSSNHAKSNHRQRVPGGAAAKLMLRGPQKSASSDMDSDYQNNNQSNATGMDENNGEEEEDHGPVDTSDILDVMTKTKQEFELGPSALNRLRGTDGNPPVIIDVIDGMEEGEEIEVAFHCHAESSPRSITTTDTEEKSHQEEQKESSLPQLLTREEAYHENASVAVAAILTPTSRGGGNSVFGEASSLASGGADLRSMRSNTCSPRSHISQASTASAFQSPKFDNDDAANAELSHINVSMRSFGSNDGSSRAPTPSKAKSGDFDFKGNFFKSPTSEPLISCETEEKLDKMSAKMLDPSKTLSDLLRAIASPNDSAQIDRAYMVRRKNACGALKVLTAHNRRRKQICWTVGVLPALTSVLQDAGEGPLDRVYPDARTRMEYEETRRRAIAALTNLAMPVPNRLAVFHTPGLVQALIDVIQKENGECLEGACAILAYLAKSNENKIIMAQVPGLFEAVLRVLKPGVLDAQQTQTKQVDSPKHHPDHPWASSVSGSDDSSVSTVDDGQDRSIMSGSTHTSSEGGESFDEEDLERDDTGMDGEEEEEEGSFEEADFTDEDDDMSTDGEDSMTGSEASGGSSMSESSDEESGSEYHPPPPTTISPKRANIKASSSKSKPLSPTGSSRSKMNSNYDKDKNISGARKNLFAMLGHLVKEKDNAYHLARVNDLVPIVVEISKMQDTPIHVLAVQLLAHLTRHRLNSKMLVFNQQTVVPALVKASYSSSEVARRHASFAIQNFSHDKSCRQELASSEKLIIALCKRARHSKDPDERLASICALKNLTDEPANLIPLSNTAECIATLMQIAHGQEEGVTEMMQFRACDALATISHWLRKIATNGQSMNAAKYGESKPSSMFVPSLKVVGFDQYE